MKAETRPSYPHGYAQVGDVRLHYVECGSGDELVYFAAWISGILVLVASSLAGPRKAPIHVIAPDMRGFNLSDKPRESKITGSNCCRRRGWSDSLFGKERAAVVGHDWGAAVAGAWRRRHPENVSKAGDIAGAASRGVARELHTSSVAAELVHVFLSTYRVAGKVGARERFRQSRTESIRLQPWQSNTFSDADIAMYKEALRQPGALDGVDPITIARTSFRSLIRGGAENKGKTVGSIRVPTLFIYGEHDFAVIPGNGAGPGPVHKSTVPRSGIPGSAHWYRTKRSMK